MGENLPPPQMMVNPDMMQMPPGAMNENLPPMMQGPPPEVMLGTPPPGFGPPGTQGWTNDDFGGMNNPPMMQQPPPVNEKQLPSLLSLKVDPPDQLVENSSTEVILPQALEEVLALKNQRALELGTEIDGGSEQQHQKEPEREPLWEKDDNVDTIVENEMEDSQQKDKEAKVSKNKKKKKRKKNRKNRENEEKQKEVARENEEGEENEETKDDVEVE